MVKNYLYIDDYASRAIVRRIYLGKEEMTGEKLLLLVEILNQMQLLSKKPISDLAGARIRYEGFHFAGGYLLMAALTQADSHHLSYFFKNPYSSALSVFEEVFRSDIHMDEKSLALMKERVFQKQEELFRNADEYSLSKMEVVYSRPIVNLNLVASMTMDDLAGAFEKVKASETGQYLFVGRKPKKDPLEEVFDYHKDFTGLPFDYSLQNRDSYDSDFLSDAVEFVVEFDKMVSVQDYEVIRSILYVFRNRIRKDIYEKYHIRAQVSFDCISNYRAVISVVLPRGRWSMVSPLFEFILSPLWIRECLANYEEGVSSVRMENIRISGNFHDAVRRMLLVSDFQLQGDVSFSKVFSVSREDFEKRASNLRKAFAYRSIHDKGELIHD